MQLLKEAPYILFKFKEIKKDEVISFCLCTYWSLVTKSTLIPFTFCKATGSKKWKYKHRSNKKIKAAEKWLKMRE